jgi:hypothetical protein
MVRRGARSWGKHTETSNCIDRGGRRRTPQPDGALLEDELLDTIECASAEAELATMLIGGREVAMILPDVRLRGVMDGIDLAREVKMR